MIHAVFIRDTEKAKEVLLVSVENSSVLGYVILFIFLTRFFMAVTTVRPWLLC